MIAFTLGLIVGLALMYMFYRRAVRNIIIVCNKKLEEDRSVWRGHNLTTYSSELDFVPGTVMQNKLDEGLIRAIKNGGGIEYLKYNDPIGGNICKAKIHVLVKIKGDE
jgi:hypothetical protein